MLQRCSCRPLAPLVRSATRQWKPVGRHSRPPAKTRHFSSCGPVDAAATAAAAAATTSSTASSSATPLATLASQLDGIAPRFEIDADDVGILSDPQEFFQVLKQKILGAKRRIYLATLYIGKTEHELIDTLRQALRNNPDLTLSILTDYFRGTREAPHPCCTSLLVPLIAEFGASRVEIRLWHTPNLTGVRESILPKRINEGWGLQHMKLYGCDDELIMSGANLSNDYFTNRQDRYHLFHSAPLTSYYERIYRATADMSYDAQPSPDADSGFSLTWPTTAPCPSPQANPKAYIAYASSILSPLLRPSASPSSAAPPNLDKAIIYPLFQLAPVTPTSTELPALTLLLSSLAHPPFYPARWTFTAGYFNMTPAIRDLLLAAVAPPPSSAAPPAAPHGTVLTAHPHANGFHNSPGISGLLPPAYTFLASRFLRTVQAQRRDDAVRLLEWRRGECGQPGGWTYHAKGLWISLPSAGRAAAEAGPSVTLVGSSNYTARSHTLDLEANALILTQNAGLRRRLQEEQEALMDSRYAREVGLDEYAKVERRVSWRVRVALWIVGLVGGAL